MGDQAMIKFITFIFVSCFCVSVLAFDQKPREPFQPLKDLFKQADKNKDGEISYVEHEDFIAMQANKGRERFAELDADGNNSVSKKEARDFAVKKLKKMQKKRENMMDERIRKLEGWDGKKRERFEELRRMKKEK